jgi:hypothetical protein
MNTQTRETRKNGVRRAVVEHRTMSHGTPSRPLAGLPLARWIPMDCHSIMDYGAAAVMGSGATMADDPRARIASIALASSGALVSLATDYRLSAVKLIPIEVHETIDYVWGLSAIAAPFVLGYWKTSPRVALMHVVAGVGNLLGSMLTDYRAYKGRARRWRPSLQAATR